MYCTRFVQTVCSHFGNLGPEKVGWLGFMAYQPLSGYLMPNPVYIYQIYMIYEHNLLITFLNEPELLFLTQLNGFKYC